MWKKVQKIIRGHNAKTKEEFRKANRRKKLGILYSFENQCAQNEFVYTPAGTIHGIEGN